MSDLDDRLRAASINTRAATTHLTPPTENDLSRRRRHRTARLATMVVLLLLVPTAVIVARQSNEPTVTTTAENPTTSAPLGDQAVEWSTPQVALQAKVIKVLSGETGFSPRATTSTARSDPGTPNSYTTLEASWPEGGGEMRLNLYFASDGVDWWAPEIRVSGTPGGEWVTFTGEYFRAPLGQPYVGNLELRGESAGIPVTLGFDGLVLQAFLPPAGCRTEPGSLSIEVLYPTIEMSSAPNTGFGVNVRLLDANCNEVNNYNDFRFDWSAGDPTMVTVIPGLAGCVPCRPQHADLTASKPGRTDLTVTVTPLDGAKPVATATMEVLVE